MNIMTEKINHVKNPLTIIAIFAGIAEVSGTIITPFIDKELQGIFIFLNRLSNNIGSSFFCNSLV